MEFEFIFFNLSGRLRSGWRLSLFALLFLMLTIVLTTLANSFFETSGITAEETLTRQAAFIFSSTIFLLAAVFAGWVCAKGIEDLPFRSLGWSLQKGWWRDLLFGSLFGAISLLLATGIAALGGGLSFAQNAAAVNSIANTVIVSALVFAFGAAGEEALFRGYPMQTLTRSKLAWVAILLTSVFFAGVHALNPNVTAFGLTNTALAGVWFVVAYLKTRSLWFPFGMHWAWNWTMAAILGLPVSGITNITPEPIWRGIDTGPTWLTGGHYGIEGGAACTVTLVISTVLLWFAPFIQPNAEMLALTNQENIKVPPSGFQPSLPPIYRDYDV